MAIPKSIKENPFKSIIAMISFVTTIGGGVYFIDARYAHASDLSVVEAHSKQTQAKTDQILDVLKLQYQMRKVILEMKEADSQVELTPEEKIELQYLRDILKKLENQQ